ncbi:MAG TPA: hypothetical protein PKM25_05290 [Candidatus Ozemobacteraceae bacterium]|nr:hypothetical protein [Candidatus Ozemobacteraceae bacterium]
MSTLESTPERRNLSRRFSDSQVAYLKGLIQREEEETRSELHHAGKSYDYREYLKARAKEVHELLQKIMLFATTKEA